MIHMSFHPLWQRNLFLLLVFHTPHSATLSRMPTGSLHDLLLSGKLKRSFSMDTAAHLSEETEHQLHDAKEGIVDFGGPGTSIV
jgi:hypothetical protein